MNFIHIAYASVARDGLGAAAIIRLVQGAQAKNLRLGVTGMLLYGNQRFLQLMEGPDQGVNELYHTIVRDTRHHSLRLVDFQRKNLRQFEQWRMGLVDIVAARDPGLTSILAGQPFTPEQFAPDTCLELLRLGGVFLGRQNLS